MADATDKGSGDDKAPTSVADIKSVVETANAEDEKGKGTGKDGGTDDDDDAGDDAGTDDGSDAADDDNADDTDDGADDADDDDADDKPAGDDQGDRKYTQFKGDGTDDQYISNLEKGYANSSAEAIRLKGERDKSVGQVDAILAAAAKDPDLAKRLNTVLNGNGGGAGDDGAGAGNGTDDKGSGTGTDGNSLKNPFVSDLQTRWQETSEKEVAALLDANPELLSDENLGKDVQHWMEVFSNDHFNRTGKLMTGGEAMEQAMKHLGIENKLVKQELANGAKKNLTPTRKRGGGKKPSGDKPEFSPEQIAMARSMGRDETWLAKNAK